MADRTWSEKGDGHDAAVAPFVHDEAERDDGDGEAPQTCPGDLAQLELGEAVLLAPGAEEAAADGEADAAGDQREEAGVEEKHLAAGGRGADVARRRRGRGGCAGPERRPARPRGRVESGRLGLPLLYCSAGWIGRENALSCRNDSVRGAKAERPAAPPARRTGWMVSVVLPVCPAKIAAATRLMEKNGRTDGTGASVMADPGAGGYNSLA